MDVTGFDVASGLSAHKGNKAGKTVTEIVERVKDGMDNASMVETTEELVEITLTEIHYTERVNTYSGKKTVSERVHIEKDTLVRKQDVQKENDRQD